MSGQEERFLSALDVALSRFREARPFCYLELGLGDLGTYRAIFSYLIHRAVDFRMDGVDVPGWDCPRIRSTRCWIHWTGSAAYLKDPPVRPHFVFIDACHGKACVTADFLGVERILEPGGVVAFHDVSEDAQGKHWQPHCQEWLRAREAVQELGLLDGSRPGWIKLGETEGTRNSFGLLYVQKEG